MAALRGNKSLGTLRRALRATWRWLLRRLVSGRRAGRARRQARGVDLLALAHRVHELERQLGRARVHYAGKQLSRQHLEQLHRHTVQEVQALLDPLEQAGNTLGPTWALDRLRGAMRHWRERFAEIGEQPLHPHDVSELQAQLLEIGTALTVCGRVNGQDGKR